MVVGLKRALRNVGICEDILRGSTVKDQKDVSPELADAHEIAIESIKRLYFMVSEVINMKTAQKPPIVDPLQELITHALTKES